MALNAYLKLKGQKSGEIKGSVIQKGRENQILVVGADHLIVSPRDAASGLPTGKRQHQPIVLTKEVDRATPVLHTVLANNENITEFQLNFWQASNTGAEVQYFTIDLVNASIASIKLEMLNNEYPENVKIPVREKIAFTYQKIIWTWRQDGITSTDDWEAQAV